MPVTKQILNRMNILTGVVSLALAGLAGYLMNRSSYQLFTGLLTRDELASKATTVFVPAIHAVYDIELRWAVVAILLLGAIVPLLAATRNRKQYEIALGKKVMLWRWIDIAVVGGLMLMTVALISGVQDFMTLKLVGGLVVIASLLGWQTERQNAEGGKSVWATYVLALVAGFLPVLLISAYAVGTPLYGMVRSPWFVYALYGTTVLTFVLSALNLFYQLRRFRAWAKYEVVERNYQVISLASRLTFAVLLIIGLKK